MQHFRILSKIVLALFTLNLVSCGTKPNIHVEDYIIGGYEGAAGGPDACTEVHTLFTDTPPAHFGLSECLRRIVGKIYLDGAALSSMQENIDVMCTSLGSCTYQQQQAINLVKQALQQGLSTRQLK